MKTPIRIEQTPAGAQMIINETPARQVPTAPLRAKRPQNDVPMELERAYIDEQEPRLFDTCKASIDKGMKNA